MTDLEKLKNVFEELKIGYTENKSSFPVDQIEIVLHYSDMTFVFDSAGKYITYDISY